MKLVGKVLLASLIGVGVAGLPESFAASGGHGMAAHFVGVQRPTPPQVVARHERPGFGGLGASGAYSTLLSGTFEVPSAGGAGGEEEFAGPPLPFYGWPVVAPPAPCIRPLLIHLVRPHPVKVPRIVYGSPYTCG
jgi:hypothetical protein